eukprot:PhM_4_TR12482/c0_g1_i1/m.58
MRRALERYFWGSMNAALMASSSSSMPPPLATDHIAHSAAAPLLTPTTPSTTFIPSELIHDLQPSELLGSKGGMPKASHPYKTLRRKKVDSRQLKFTKLRLQPWYTCPLCGEPKQAETVCRRLQCRQVRP